MLEIRQAPRAIEAAPGYKYRMIRANLLDEPCHPEAAQPLKAWCFVGTDDLWALTDDETGAKLPDEQGPWRLLKPILLTGSDPDEQEAEALIRQYGYCCFDNHDAD